MSLTYLKLNWYFFVLHIFENLSSTFSLDATRIELFHSSFIGSIGAHFYSIVLPYPSGLHDSL